jgi:hypothetical protein
MEDGKGKMEDGRGKNGRCKMEDGNRTSSFFAVKILFCTFIIKNATRRKYILQ